MVIIGYVLWGLVLWGVLTLILPGAVYYWVIMLLGVLTFIALCIVAAAAIIDWLQEKKAERFWNER